jgi:hypothetical protein
MEVRFELQVAVEDRAISSSQLLLVIWICAGNSSWQS